MACTVITTSEQEVFTGDYSFEDLDTIKDNSLDLFHNPRINGIKTKKSSSFKESEASWQESLTEYLEKMGYEKDDISDIIDELIDLRDEAVSGIYEVMIYDI